MVFVNDTGPPSRKMPPAPALPLLPERVLFVTVSVPPLSMPAPA
jgi:hypothetical protein